RPSSAGPSSVCRCTDVLRVGGNRRHATRHRRGPDAARERASGTRITMSVESIEDAVAKIETEGGKVLQGKMPIPGMGYFAICEDTEGNQIGIFAVDPTATM